MFALGCCVSCSRGEPDLAAIADSVNAKCPKMLDSETRIDKVMLIPPDTLRYIYTLVNLPAGSMDTAGFRKALWPGLLAHVRISGELRPLREKKIVFQYVYLDRAGNLACTFTVPPAYYVPLNTEP